MVSESHQYTRFSQLLSDFKALDFAPLYLARAGDFSLERTLRPIIEDIQSKLNKTNDVLDLIQPGVVEAVNSVIHAIITFTISTNRGTSQDILANSNKIVTEYQNFLEKMLAYWPTIVALYLDKNSSTQDQLNEQARLSTSQINELKSRLETQLTEFNRDSQKILDRRDILIQEGGFSDSAKKYDFQSRFWLVGIVVVALTLICIIICFINSCWWNFNCVNLNDKELKSNSPLVNTLFYFELIKKTLLRLLILSMLIYLLKFCIKNYNALRHNFIINSHKRNSLSAALSLFGRVGEGPDRNSILTLASKEIFEHQKTGYLSKDDMNFNFNLVEKIADLIKSKSS